MRVLLIEDDIKVANSISLALATYSGIVCDIARRGGEGIAIGNLYDYDIIILDLMLPDIDGYQVLLQLRALKIKIPILILSGLSSPEQKIRGLDNGADDYLTKPFNNRELIARIQAIVRRSKGKSHSIVKFGQVVVNLDDRIVTVNNQELKLTPTEYSILQLLVRRRGTVLTKEMFINHLYGGSNERQPKIVDVFVCKLRDKLKEASGGTEYITTVWGRGYILKEDVGDGNASSDSMTIC